MSLVRWPHGHLAHALAVQLAGGTDAGGRIYTDLPRTRTYPLLVVQEAGLGTLGTDSAIQADELRLQIDAWASTRQGAQSIAAQVFRLLDARFPEALANQTLTVADEAVPGRIYECSIERIRRSGGGTPYFDEIARVYRATAFYHVKVNL
jgi:hypothetical protein